MIFSLILALIFGKFSVFIILGYVLVRLIRVPSVREKLPVVLLNLTIILAFSLINIPVTHCQFDNTIPIPFQPSPVGEVYAAVHNGITKVLTGIENYVYSDNDGDSLSNTFLFRATNLGGPSIYLNGHNSFYANSLGNHRVIETTGEITTE